MRRKKILELQKRTLNRKRKLKQHYDSINQANKTSESQKNLIYFMQCLERVKMEVTSRKQCNKEALKNKNKISTFNISDKRRIMELLLCKEDILTKVLIKIFRKMKIKDLEK